MCAIYWLDCCHGMSVGFLPFLGRLTKTVCHRNARQCIWQTSLDDKTCNSSLLKKFMKERTMSDEVEKMMSLLAKDGGAKIYLSIFWEEFRSSPILFIA